MTMRTAGGACRQAAVAAPAQETPEALERPGRAEAEAAVRTLLRWAGDDPDREGLAGTPERVVRAYEEFFAGYGQDPVGILQRTFRLEEHTSELQSLMRFSYAVFCLKKNHYLLHYLDLLSC